MPRILIFSGAGRYADPWHPFEETTSAVAQIATQMGADVVVNPSRPDAFDALDEFDLVVVNSGGGDPDDRPRPEPAWQDAQLRLAAYLDDGGPLLGLHTAANTFPDWPAWRDFLGGAWLPGTSHHPARSYALFEATETFADHPLFAGILPQPGLPELDGRPTVLCNDERYTDLVLYQDAVPHLVHETGGVVQPCGWLTRERVLYDGLGHDSRSYASASRCQLLTNELAYLLSLA